MPRSKSTADRIPRRASIAKSVDPKRKRHRGRVDRAIKRRAARDKFSTSLASEVAAGWARRKSKRNSGASKKKAKLLKRLALAAP